MFLWAIQQESGSGVEQSMTKDCRKVATSGIADTHYFFFFTRMICNLSRCFYLPEA